MPPATLPVDVRAVLPTSGGTALFIGNNEKVFLLYVDNAVGSSIAMFLGKVEPARPQTHDLMVHMLTGMGAKVDRVVINDYSGETYFARLLLSMENEVAEKKIVELDARPSDCLALALRVQAPIYIARDVWDDVEDMSELLRRMEAQGQAELMDLSEEDDEEEN